MLALQPDFGQACLVLFAWGVMYFVAGAPILLLMGMAGLVVFGGTLAYQYSEHFARRIDGFLSPDVDPRTQLDMPQTRSKRVGFSALVLVRGR